MNGSTGGGLATARISVQRIGGLCAGRGADRMPNIPQDPPALDVLRRIAARGPDGLARRALFDDGWPTGVAAGLLDALRSRGYVRLDRATGRWVATLSGLRRAEQAAAPPTVSQR
jgi:hypothetical protein